MINAKTDAQSEDRTVTIMQIHHVQLAMPAGKETDARQFYAQALGLDEVGKPANLAKRGGCWFEQGSVRVHLGIDPEFHPAKKAHPAFIVNDLGVMRERLKQEGYTIKDDAPLAGFTRAFVYDPFGNRIELMETAL
ncbi:MAG: VOC family protein [Sulfitobacter sp.]